MRLRIMTSAFVLAVLVTPLCAQTESRTIAEILKRAKPGFSLVARAGLTPEARDYFDKRFPGQDPSHVEGDFDGDGDVDHAVIASRAPSKEAKLFVVFAESRAFRIGHAVGLGDEGDILLSVVRRGTRVKASEAIPGSKATTMVLEHDSVLVTYFEKAAVLYFWNGRTKRMESLQVAD